MMWKPAGCDIVHGGAFELLPVAPSLRLTINPICDSLVPNHPQSLSMHRTKDPKTRNPGMWIDGTDGGADSVWLGRNYRP